MNLFIYYISVQDTSALKPIMEPDPIAFTFETIGWSILLWVVIISVIIITILAGLNYQKNKYKRDALKVLSDLRLDDSIEINQQIAVQLKLVAMQTYGRHSVAHLSGKAWASFLESKGNNIEFKNLDSFLMECLYQNKSDIAQTNQFLTFSKKWIKSHA